MQLELNADADLQLYLWFRNIWWIIQFGIGLPMHEWSLTTAFGLTMSAPVDKFNVHPARRNSLAVIEFFFVALQPSAVSFRLQNAIFGLSVINASYVIHVHLVPSQNIWKSVQGSILIVFEKCPQENVPTQ